MGLVELLVVQRPLVRLNDLRLRINYRDGVIVAGRVSEAKAARALPVLEGLLSARDAAHRHLLDAINLGGGSQTDLTNFVVVGRAVVKAGASHVATVAARLLILVVSLSLFMALSDMVELMGLLSVLIHVGDVVTVIVGRHEVDSHFPAIARWKVLASAS